MKNSGKNSGESGKNSDVSKIAVVLKIDLKVDVHRHDRVCRLAKWIRSFQGVESVKGVDVDRNKLTVIGNFDPSELREWIERKTENKVEIISLAPNRTGSDGKDTNITGEEPKKKKESEDPHVTVLKMKLDCDGCIKTVWKLINKSKGYVDMSIDREKDLMTVQGSMDVKALVELLKKKLKRNVEIVWEKEDCRGSNNKENLGDAAANRLKNENELLKKKLKRIGEIALEKEEGDSRNQKDKGDGGDATRNQKDKGDGGDATADGEVERKKEQMPSGNGYPYMYQVHAPQLFSDENPNACVVM